MSQQRGFLDLLFILLCSAMVMLSQSLPLGSIDAAPARLGSGGVSPIHADQVRPLIVSEHAIDLKDQPVDRLDDLADLLSEDDVLVIMPRHATVSHHRVMAVWHELRQMSLPVKLGVAPRTEPDDARPARPRRTSAPMDQAKRNGA